MFTNNVLNEDQVNQIEEKTKNISRLDLNENDKKFSSINKRNLTILNGNQVNNELFDSKYFNYPGYKNILNNNSINIFNNLIDNQNENSINFNNSNLFNVKKDSQEKDMKKEKITNNQIIAPIFYSLIKQNDESINNDGKSLNNKIIGNNNIIKTENNLYNNILMIHPYNNILINPNYYLLNNSMNRFIYPRLNQLLISSPYFPLNYNEEISSNNLNSFQQKNEICLNFNKENQTNLKENKNEFIGKKKFD